MRKPANRLPHHFRSEQRFHPVDLDQQFGSVSVDVDQNRKRVARSVHKGVHLGGMETFLLWVEKHHRNTCVEAKQLTLCYSAFRHATVEIGGLEGNRDRRTVNGDGYNAGIVIYCRNANLCLSGIVRRCVVSVITAVLSVVSASAVVSVSAVLIVSGGVLGRLLAAVVSAARIRRGFVVPIAAGIRGRGGIASGFGRTACSV